MKKYDFEAGDPVLVRDSDNNKWRYNIFSHSDENNETHPYRVINDIGYKQCLPYKRYEYLINTNNKPFKYGDLVKVYSNQYKTYMLCIWPDRVPKSDVENTFFNVANVNFSGKYSPSCGFHKDDKIELASLSDLEEFNKVLNNAKFYWDLNKLQLIKLKKFVNGDIVINPCNNEMFIVKEDCENNLTPINTYVFLKVLDKGNEYAGICYDWAVLPTPKCRLATDKEKETLLNELHKRGKDWDFKSKKVIPYNDLSQFKSGDYLHVEYGNDATYVLIFDHTTKYGINSYSNTSIGVDYVYMKNNSFSFRFTKICKATEEEIEKFNDLLKKKGKKWDSVNKQIVDYKWKPEYGTYYYTLTPTLKINRFCWYNNNTDIDLWEAGNCFKTEEEVKQIIKMIKTNL